MLITDGLTAASLGAHYQRIICASRPLLSAREGDLHLVPPVPDTPQDIHEQALQGLVSLGVLTEYRYIDAKPQPAILAVRA